MAAWEVIMLFFSLILYISVFDLPSRMIDLFLVVFNLTIRLLVLLVIFWPYYLINLIGADVDIVFGSLDSVCVMWWQQWDNLADNLV